MIRSASAFRYPILFEGSAPLGSWCGSGWIMGMSGLEAVSAGGQDLLGELSQKSPSTPRIESYQVTASFGACGSLGTEKGSIEGEHSTVSGDFPVSAGRRVPGDADDRSVESEPAHGAVEWVIAEREHSAIGAD